MRNTSAIFRREMASFFLSPIAYVVICLFLLANGWTFYFNANVYRDSPQQIDFIVRSIFNWVPFWSLLLAPIITMRLFAEEKRTGTLETLMTAPVTEFQVVAGKFLAAEVFYLLIWLTLLLHLLILEVLGNPDWGPVIAVYTATAALGALMLSLGLLASALTRNQIVAVIVSLVGSFLLLVVDMLRRLFPDDPDAERFFDFAGILGHFGNEYDRGVVDLRFIALYLIGAAVFLFFTVKVLEARKWR